MQSQPRSSHFLNKLYRVERPESCCSCPRPLWKISITVKRTPFLFTQLVRLSKMSFHSGPSADRDSFSSYLQSSTNILALLGAGLSASSGLPTFRGAGGLWRTHDAMSLATPEAFNRDPGLVWQFYSYRRHMALQAKPNPAHSALAELARRRQRFVTLTQNVDGIIYSNSKRAVW